MFAIRVAVISYGDISLSYDLDLCFPWDAIVGAAFAGDADADDSDVGVTLDAADDSASNAKHKNKKLQNSCPWPTVNNSSAHNTHPSTNTILSTQTSTLPTGQTNPASET